MIYLDYNATTPLCEAARTAMLPFLEGKFGNPSSVHAAGREARAAIDDARDGLADLLGAKPHELIFTSGGTEANNLAILGLARSRTARGKHLISAKTEHHAVLNTIEHLEKREGFEVTWLNVSQAGRVDLDQLADTIREDTVLVSIMHANNETGVIQPLREISEICRERGVLLHSDMVQSFGKLAPVIRSQNATPARSEGSRHESFKVTQRDLATPILSGRDDLRSLVDAASFAAHKFYGPKGAGLLFLRGGIPIEPVHFGGAHENQRRPGTENVAAIAGMAAAAAFAHRAAQLVWWGAWWHRTFCWRWGCRSPSPDQPSVFPSENTRPKRKFRRRLGLFQRLCSERMRNAARKQSPFRQLEFLFDASVISQLASAQELQDRARSLLRRLNAGILTNR